MRCGLTFSEVAGFDAKPGRGRNQGLKGPLSIDFARTGEDGPWVITGLRGGTPLGEATVTLRAVRFSRRSPRVRLHLTGFILSCHKTVLFPCPNYTIGFRTN